MNLESGSLRGQLARRLLFALVLAFGIGLVLLDISIRHLTSDFVNGRLEHDADNLIAALEQKDGQWQIPPERQATVYQRVLSGHYFIIKAGNQTLSSRSLWDSLINIENIDQGKQRSGLLQSDHSNTGVPDDQSWQWYAVGIVIDEQPITVWLAEDISDIQHSVHKLRYQALLFVAVTLLILMLWQWRILQCSFARLNPIREQIRQLRFGEALPTTHAAPAEVRPLISEIHRLLQQLEKRVSRSRNALGNLAHDMKRPIQQLQLLSRNLPVDIQREQTQALTNLQQLVERELKRARIAGVSSPGRHFNLNEELPALIQVLQRIYPDTSLDSQYPADGVMPQDRDDLLELIGNLLDNACKYGKGKVYLKITNKQQQWHIEVDDNGAGIEAELRHKLLQRGQRLDESSDIEGSGLGLAICRDIADSYHGKLQLSKSALGGLAVSVILPCQPPEQA